MVWQNRLKSINDKKKIVYEQGHRELDANSRPSLAEIIGQMGFDWVAVDLEHGSIDLAKLPDIFRALELGNTLPIVRLGHGDEKDCKHALDAGASGVIIPMVNNSEKLKNVIDYCNGPIGKRELLFQEQIYSDIILRATNGGSKAINNS